MQSVTWYNEVNSKKHNETDKAMNVNFKIKNFLNINRCKDTSSLDVLHWTVCKVSLQIYLTLLEIRKAQAPCSAPGIAQDKPAERLFFNLLDGLACDLEGLGAGAGQFSKPKFFLIS
ncbi:hypothetical protein BIV60_07500 [Bacillus sp. MUM 116]|nr:hypothetical protein BIV60_07500 [Bacillus sp. MUM 116]